MKIADIPSKYPIPFAADAGVGFIRTVPVPSQIGITPGAASFTDGFPPLNFEQISVGGIPPWGADMNGLMNSVTAWLQWVAAGGVPVKYDASYSTSIGGYPKGALLQADTLGNGKYWLSSVDDNTTNPNTGGANWLPFPDVIVQLQRGNYAVDTGPANQVTIVLSPPPGSFAAIVGAPIRVKVASNSTINNPTIVINGLAPATIVNPDGTSLSIGQLIGGGIMEGFPRDDGKFQISIPIKGTSAPTNFITGVIYLWGNETAPTGTLECNGQTLLIASYPALYAVLGTRYGGDGVNNFKVPDLRGEFVRGWDHGRGLDPNAATRTNAGGGITGDHVGTNEADVFRTHTHDISGVGTSVTPAHVGGGDQVIDTPSPPPGASRNSLADIGGGGAAVNTGTSAIGGAETRPVNVYLMYIIAY